MIAFTFLKYFFILPVYTYNSDVCMYKIIDSILDFQSLQYWKKNILHRREPTLVIPIH